jgi:hypothetical protein
MLEMLTPYLFKSNRRKTSQEHPSAKGRSLMLKALRTVGTMYILSTFSYKNALRIEKSHPYLWLKIFLHKICKAEYMRVIFSFLL